ncbi:RNA polymerase sigma factor [Aquimonas sp.]|jgi:RNA polymerase sigma-70 factor (ECF subfamily)|uniref:RNA polymerase sigma factor n=1 Tax=Aquimonas sp. TaxID=1872588 RepID=UPI0037C12AB1
MSSDPTAILSAARGGDAAAFRQLVELHSRAVFQLCWRITRDVALAEDAAQEAFYKAWRALAEFDGRAAFSTWLHRIAVNAALEQLRRNARHRHQQSESDADGEDASSLDLFVDAEPDVDTESHHAAPGPQAHARAAELATRVSAELTQMSVMERTAFVLRHVEGESLEQIAAQLSLNIGQSKQAIFRAVRKLRAALQDWS